MTCPQCGGQLRVVRRSSMSYLNQSQFDAIKAGDWFCERCPGNGRGNSQLCYWWDHEVESYQGHYMLTAYDAAEIAAKNKSRIKTDFEKRRDAIASEIKRACAIGKLHTTVSVLDLGEDTDIVMAELKRLGYVVYTGRSDYFITWSNPGLI